jgi:hypothetical protein
MRPVYETSADRANQEIVKVKIEMLLKQPLTALPPRHCFDYAATRQGQVTQLIEVKCRTNPVNQYPTFMLCLEKFINAANHCQINQYITTSLWVQWTDALGSIDMLQPFEDWRIGGRADRGDSQDMGIVVHIPIQDFTIHPDPTKS